MTHPNHPSVDQSDRVVENLHFGIYHMRQAVGGQLSIIVSIILEAM